jgi:phosphate acetyltransferase
MNFIESMKEKAREVGKRLVLPEGCEERTVAAAAIIASQRIASEVILLGDQTKIQEVAAKRGVSLEGVTTINPLTSDLNEEFAAEYFDIRKKKGITLDEAREAMKDFMRFGAMMVRLGKADAMVSGAASPTADVIRAGLTVIGTAPGIKTATSTFVMDMHNPKWGQNGLMLFSDCSVIPVPTSEQLVDISILSARFFAKMIGGIPVVALLSFSTKGSAGTTDDVTRIHEAVVLAHAREPFLMLDGELQADAALIPEVTAKKAPGSPISGKVNILVFPSLNAGNIGYKLVQRFAGADAYGPFLQGFAKPISDLSRGCSVDDIVGTCAVTLVESANIY